MIIKDIEELINYSNVVNKKYYPNVAESLDVMKQLTQINKENSKVFFLEVTEETPGQLDLRIKSVDIIKNSDGVFTLTKEIEVIDLDE